MNKPVLIESQTVVVEKDANATVPLKPTYGILLGLSFAHFLNDLMQSLLPAVYPLLKDSYQLDFTQIGLITLVFQFTSSLLQPMVGIYTDRRPLPWSLPIAMAATFFGLILLANAHTYWVILVAAGMVGIGSAVFHPESARVARLASGGRYGFAQSIFQVGGNSGSAAGPLLAALVIVPLGQGSIAWFSIVAALAMVILFQVGRWYRPRVTARKAASAVVSTFSHLSRKRVIGAIAVLLLILVSKQFYISSFSSYYTFYLIHKFGLSTQSAQLFLFSFWASTAVGILIGGRIGDYFGRKRVLWFSILGVLPFTLALPFVGLVWTGILACCAALILSFTAPSIIVFGQELLPRSVGAMSGLFYGVAFGVAGIGAAVLGRLADAYGIEAVFQMCAFLPVLGLVAIFLPNTGKRSSAAH